MLNAMTIDLEDWGVAVLGPGVAISEHVVANTERMLDLLGQHGVRATFFALGRVCERFPQLLPAVAAAGHEIASHGYGHELVYDLTPEGFEADVRRSVEVIESQTGRRPIGYRAPAFSITRQSLWAGPVLARMGFRFSSSIFPIRKQRYGIADWPSVPNFWPTCDLMEFPLATLSVFGRRVPVCGGGYMRLWPGRVHAAAIARQNAAGYPAVIYVHPYELVPGEVGSFMRAGYRVSWRRRVMQSLWRSRVAPRLRMLLDEFAFGTVSEALAALSPVTLGRPSRKQRAGTCVLEQHAPATA